VGREVEMVPGTGRGIRHVNWCWKRFEDGSRMLGER
jgi:hypothetical protein